MKPIRGFRYKCMICHDYDFCKACFHKKEHPHDFIIRIKFPLSLEDINALFSQFTKKVNTKDYVDSDYMCSHCNKSIAGEKYMCLECKFCLCKQCEYSGSHGMHAMLYVKASKSQALSQMVRAHGLCHTTNLLNQTTDQEALDIARRNFAHPKVVDDLMQCRQTKNPLLVYARTPISKEVWLKQRDNIVAILGGRKAICVDSKKVQSAEHICGNKESQGWVYYSLREAGTLNPILIFQEIDDLCSRDG